MNSETDPRRCSARRHKERRTNPYAFNSPEWIAMMKEQFVLWPKQDRRQGDRRSSDRRKLERRTLVRSPNSTRYARETKLYLTEDILEESEKQMIMELFRDD
jgi:hypothetical protein